MNRQRCCCAGGRGCCPPPLFFCPAIREDTPSGLTFPVSFQKVSAQTGAPLAGASFSLTCRGTVIARAISGTDGALHFGQIAPGTYRLIETEAPPGYAPVSPSDVVVACDGTVTLGGQPASVPIANAQTLSTIIIQQITSTGTVLSTQTLSVPAGTYGPIAPTPISGYRFVGQAPESAPVSGTIAAGQTLAVIFVFEPEV